LADAEEDLASSEVTTDSEFSSNTDGDGVSATSDQYGAEASTPGGDPDALAPVSDPQGDVVDEVPTSGPLPNTGGMSILAVILPIAGFLLLCVSIIHRIKGNR
jgi:hypothetical protein